MDRITISSLVLLIATVTVSVVHSEDDAPPDCGQKADIAMICDSSRSIWIKHFEEQMKFVAEVAETIGVGNEDGNQMSLTLFGEFVTPIFTFNSHETAQDVYDKINAVTHLKEGKTRTDKALKQARTDGFLKSDGAREGVPKVVILLTDGVSRFPKQTAEEAKLLKDTGVVVFAIGIGRGIKMSELKAIGSEPSSNYVFKVERFEELQKIKNRLAARACEVTLPPVTTPAPTTPEPTTPEKGILGIDDLLKPKATLPPFVEIPDLLINACESKKADVVFVLDKSGSIGQENFNKIRAWLKELADVFDLGAESTRVGIVSFADDVDVDLEIFDTADVKTLEDSIDGITYESGGTNTADAIDEATLMLRPHGATRMDAAHIIILLTDGQSQVPQYTTKAAKAAQARGIIIFAIGITDAVDETEMKDIASNPNEEHMFLLSDFDRLDSDLRNRLAEATCFAEKAQRDASLCGSGKEEVDIVWGIDIRGLSVDEMKYPTDLIKGVSQRFDLDSGLIRMGVSTNCAGQNIAMRRSKSRESFRMNIDKIQEMGLAGLYKAVRTQGHSKRSGSRRNSKKISVLFITGPISDHRYIRSAFLRSQKDGHEIFAVVLENHFDRDQLKQIVSTPADEHILEVAQISDYNSIEGKLGDRLCDKI